MHGKSLSRRELLRAAAALGAAGAVGFKSVERAEARPKHGKTPPMPPQDMAALDAALGKKGSYIEEEGVYTITLPRADRHTLKWWRFTIICLASSRA